MVIFRFEDAYLISFTQVAANATHFFVIAST